MTAQLPFDETVSPPSRADALEATWREYYRHAGEAPRNPAARDFLHQDLAGALARLIPADASVLEVGSGEGDLLAALPNARRRGIDYLPETVARARARHPEIGFAVEDAIAPPAELLERADAVICDRLCHSVLDVKALLSGLKRRLAPDGRIYLTAFNYLWEVPVRLAELAGLKRPAPTANWLSDSDFRNLYDITGLEVVRFEDRLLLPAELPVALHGAQPLRGAGAVHEARLPLPDLRSARSGHGARRRGRRASASSCRPATRRATSPRRPPAPR